MMAYPIKKIRIANADQMADDLGGMRLMSCPTGRDNRIIKSAGRAVR